MLSGYPHTYKAHGLTISSEVELPGLTPHDGAPDVVIREGSVERVGAEEERDFGYSHASPGRYYVVHRMVGNLEVRGGTQVILDIFDDAPEGVVQTLVTNLSLGIVLHQRKVVTLHASAVSIEGQVVAFVGDKGWGKSTMASALYRRGHEVITDDVLGIDVSETEQPHARTGFAQLKLWPDAVNSTLGEDPNLLERIYSESDKRVRSTDVPTSFDPKPLTNIYVLGGSDKLQIEPLSSQHAFMHLMRHAYTSRILQKTEALRWHFDQLSHVVNQVTVWTLNRPNDLSLLPKVARRIEGGYTDVCQQESFPDGKRV
jgi:hypothetical protein